jgi:anionic cell wall polymer biosynthesis LytR-Cps2A-Psr (LCP) family protein
MKDMGAVNDAIGGVTVDIDTDMTNLDPAFTEGATVHLDGKQAESYLRARMDVGGGTNKERMARQNQYMQKAYAMVTGQLRENPDYINDLYDQLDSKVESDGTPKRISTIADKLMRYDNMGIIQFDGEVKTGDTIGEGKEHEEFYVDEGSILANFKKVMNIREYTEADEEAEDEDE